LQQLAINGNVAHSNDSVSVKISKEIAPFQQDFPTYECDAKIDSIGLPESGKKSDS